MSITMSDAMRIDNLIKEKQRNGIKIINCATGTPNIPPPNSFYCDKNDTYNTYEYGPAQGYPKVRQYLIDYEDVPVHSIDNILITNGARPGIFATLRTLIKQSEDEVIMIGPCWSSYIDMVKLCGGRPKIVLPESANLELTIGDVLKQTSGNTKAIVINIPNNPTGAIYTQDFIDDIIKYCHFNEIYCIMDLIYKDLIYFNNNKINYNFTNKNIIYIDGFSKKYGIPGWRFGYVYSHNTELIKEITNCHSIFSGPANTLIQEIVCRGSHTRPVDSVDRIRKEYENRRNLLAEKLNKHKDRFEFNIPEGGFYFYIKIKPDPAEFCRKLLEEYNIAITPGTSYGLEDYIRLSFANIFLYDIDNILEGMVAIDKKLTNS